MTDRPIADYGLLADGHSGALVSGDGSIDWLCLPRFDSPAVFGRLLDVRAGHWSISPHEPFDMQRRYAPESLVLETQFTTSTGAMMLTDALVFGDDERGHDIGLDAPHILARRIEVTDGEVALDAEFAPRPEYGVVSPRLQVVDGGVVARGGAAAFLLAGPPPTAIDGATALWRLGLTAGQTLSFALQYVSTGQPMPDAWTDKQIRQRLVDTEKGWRSWSELHQRYEGPWRDEVHHSGRVLQALTYQPTGAIVAAATTSLPEEVGSARNWDYRYTWVRDASLTMQALWVAACPDEAGRFLSFLINAAGTSPQRAGGLQIMYGIGGEHDLAERELPHLEGWRSSRPVRIGNAAWDQIQNDGYGALLDALYRYRDNLGDIKPEMVEFLVSIATTAAEVWTEPDQGIWELRGEPRHHLHSKLMCWVALDRAVRLADQFGVARHAPGWAETAGLIRQAILEEGWSEELGAYTQSFGSAQLDSSTLLLAITGFLPATDPRMRSTIEQIAARLSAPCGLLYRYLDDGDGLAGGESPFLICSYWLAECWALAGDLGAAREIFERATAYANDVGLLSEEADPATGELLGNFPQAFSHIGLVNAAWTISQAEAGMPPGGSGQ